MTHEEVTGLYWLIGWCFTVLAILIGGLAAMRSEHVRAMRELELGAVADEDTDDDEEDESCWL